MVVPPRSPASVSPAWAAAEVGSTKMPSASSVRSDVRIASSSTSTIVAATRADRGEDLAGPRRPGRSGCPRRWSTRPRRAPRPPLPPGTRAASGAQAVDLHADQPRNALDDAGLVEPPEAQRDAQQQRPAAERRDDGVGRPAQRLDDLVGERRRAGRNAGCQRCDAYATPGPASSSAARAASPAAERGPGTVTIEAPCARTCTSFAGDASAGTNTRARIPARAAYAANDAPAFPDESTISSRDPAPDQPADGHRDAAVLERARRQRALELREQAWSAAQLDQTRHRLAQRHDIRRRQPAAIAPDAARRPVDQRRGIGRRQSSSSGEPHASQRHGAMPLASVRASAAAQVAHPATMPSREDHRHPRRHAVDRPDLRARRHGRGPDGPVGGRAGTDPALFRRYVDLTIKPLLVGTDPLQPGRHWERLVHATHERPYPTPIEIAGVIDIALWDLVGKAAGLPIHVLLGGAARTEFDLYWSCGAGGNRTPAEMAAALEVGLKDGFKAFKIRMDWAPLRIDQDPRKDMEMARVCRELVGPDAWIGFDVNRAYTVSTAIRQGRAPRGARLRPPRGAAAAVRPARPSPGRRRARHPGLGRRELSTDDGSSATSIELANPDILQPDIVDAGGISETVRIFQLAEVHAKPVMPHCPSAGLLSIASLQAYATVPGGTRPHEYGTEYGPRPEQDSRSCTGSRCCR